MNFKVGCKKDPVVHPKDMKDGQTGICDENSVAVMAISEGWLVELLTGKCWATSRRELDIRVRLCDFELKEV